MPPYENEEAGSDIMTGLPPCHTHVEKDFELITPYDSAPHPWYPLWDDGTNELG